MSQTVSIQYDANNSRQVYAYHQLKTALEHLQYRLEDVNPKNKIYFILDTFSLTAESFSITHNKNQPILIQGGDDRGLIYGVQSFIEDLKNGIKLNDIKNKSEKPFLPLRAIKFDLPWDTYRHSYSLDQHDAVCRDTNYWAAFLDMMSVNRLNALSLWNLHPYVYFIKPVHYPEASPWNNQQMQDWQLLFHTILRMAHDRAIDTYVMPFNIFVSPEFAKAHHVAMDNLEHHFFVKGDTSQIIRNYTQECVTQLLNEYPLLTGMGITLGEGMGGMTPMQREEWINQTMLAGIQKAHRPVKLIHRIPLSSNTGSGGATSLETEQLTRKELELEADQGYLEAPIWADLKFNWSHAHSSTKLIKVHGGKLYDTYFKPVSDKYKITWTARNEDFFCLRWGEPEFIKNHIIENTKDYSGGYFIGSECYIPAKDYFSLDSFNIPWKYAFERQWYYYYLWGRLMYDPHLSEVSMIAAMNQRYPGLGDVLFKAMKYASRTPLRLASFFDSGWDFTLYSEGLMALDNTVKRVEYISINRLIQQPPLDSQYLGIKEYTDLLSLHQPIPFNRITPVQLVTDLNRECHQALDLVKKINPKKDRALQEEVSDIEAWSYLGLHLHSKIKAGLSLQRYRVTGNADDKEMALKWYDEELMYWDKVIDVTQKLYRPMPLVHLSEQDGKPSRENDFLRFHWSILREQVMKDREMIEKD